MNNQLPHRRPYSLYTKSNFYKMHSQTYSCSPQPFIKGTELLPPLNSNVPSFTSASNQVRFINIVN